LLRAQQVGSQKQTPVNQQTLFQLNQPSQGYKTFDMRQIYAVNGKYPATQVPTGPGLTVANSQKSNVAMKQNNSNQHFKHHSRQNSANQTALQVARPAKTLQAHHQRNLSDKVHMPSQMLKQIHNPMNANIQEILHQIQQREEMSTREHVKHKQIYPQTEIRKQVGSSRQSVHGAKLEDSLSHKRLDMYHPDPNIYSATFKENFTKDPVRLATSTQSYRITQALKSSEKSTPKVYKTTKLKTTLR
jgi:hypothetical protein